MSQDELVGGVIENIIEVDQLFTVLPFMLLTGNVFVNEEDTPGDVNTFLGVGDTITAKNPATFTPRGFGMTIISGDAEVNGLFEATRRSGPYSQSAIQLSSKAKHVARIFRYLMIYGDSVEPFQFDGLANLVDPARQLDTAGAEGFDLTLDFLDELGDQIIAKDGKVDYYIMAAITRRTFRRRLRQLGGASIGEVKELPDGTEVPAYNNAGVFRNDYIRTDVVKGMNNNTTSVFAGTFDDGSGKAGLSGLMPLEAEPFEVVELGPAEAKDEDIWRVKWYAGLALFDRGGLAEYQGINASSFSIEPPF